jgi:hypothetical protein
MSVPTLGSQLKEKTVGSRLNKARELITEQLMRIIRGDTGSKQKHKDNPSVTLKLYNDLGLYGSDLFVHNMQLDHMVETQFSRDLKMWGREQDLTITEDDWFHNCDRDDPCRSCYPTAITISWK